MPKQTAYDRAKVPSAFWIALFSGLAVVFTGMIVEAEGHGWVKWLGVVIIVAGIVGGRYFALYLMRAKPTET